MEAPQTNKVDVESLDFEISTNPLQAIGGSQIFQTDKYFAIYGNDLLLGIKPQQERAQLTLNHYQAYRLGLSLFEEVFCPGSDQACFLSEDQSWMASLIGEDPNEGMCSEKYQQNLFPAIINECYDIKSCKDWVSELHNCGFRPSLGVVNGFDYNDNLAFYLLVEPLNHKSKSIPVLTLASFKFSEQQQHDIALCPASSRLDYALGMLCESAQPAFFDALREFLALYRQLSQWPSELESLTAITLDFYNKNRNTASIAVDRQLAGELRRFIDEANEYYQDKWQMSSIIDFIMRYNEFNFESVQFQRSRIEQLFVRKRSYQKMARILTKNGSDSFEFDRYLTEQLRSFQETCCAV